MEYRKLPHGEERISVLGLGAGSLGESSPEEIEAVYRKAIENGIDFFDLCGGNSAVFESFGKAIKGHRKDVFFQLHFGAVYDKEGNYGWSRDLAEIKRTYAWEMETMGVEDIDFGFLHCIDDEKDLDAIKNDGILDFVLDLKRKGIVRHLGFSSHTPEIANKLLDIGGMDLMMFSINPAFDFERAGKDDYGFGKRSEREELFLRCQREGIGISVMKPFNGGRLLSASTSPFKTALTKEQCLSYVLDRPGVLLALPGVRNLSDLDEILHFEKATKEEKDYSAFGKGAPKDLLGNCVYCDHCLPCPAGLDIGLINKYYDLALAGDAIAAKHYDKLTKKADLCLSCGHCDRRCPFSAKPTERMKEIADYFRKR